MIKKHHFWKTIVNQLGKLSVKEPTEKAFKFLTKASVVSFNKVLTKLLLLISFTPSFLSYVKVLWERYLLAATLRLLYVMRCRVASDHRAVRPYLRFA